MAEKFLGRRLTQEEMAQAVTTNLTDYDTAKKYFEEMKKGNKDTYTKGSADKKTKDEETSYKGYHISKGQHETGLSGYKIDNPNGRRPLMDFYKTIGDAKEAIDKFGIYLGKDSYTKGSADRKTKDVRYPNTEEAQQYQRLIGVKQFDPQEREALEKYYGKKIPITQVHNYRMYLFENKIFKDSLKGSADRKTKDDDKSDELKMMIQQMGKVEGIRAFAKKYPEYVPQFASYFKKKVEERGGSKDGGPGSGQKGHKTAQFADPTTHKERRKTLADLKLYFNKAVKSGNRKEAVKISNRMAHLTSLQLKG